MATEKSITTSIDHPAEITPAFPQMGAYKVDATSTENALAFAADLEKMAAHFRAVAGDLRQINRTDAERALQDLEHRAVDFADYCHAILD